MQRSEWLMLDTARPFPYTPTQKIKILLFNVIHGSLYSKTLGGQFPLGKPAVMNRLAYRPSWKKQENLYAV
jgi:hypothetical protein